MGLTKLDWVLAAGIVAALGGSLVAQPDLSQPNFEFMPDMVNSVRSQSQDAPSRLSCPRIVPSDFFFCSQTRSTNFSRPISVRLGS